MLPITRGIYHLSILLQYSDYKVAFSFSRSIGLRGDIWKDNCVCILPLRTQTLHHRSSLGFLRMYHPAVRAQQLLEGKFPCRKRQSMLNVVTMAHQEGDLDTLVVFYHGGESSVVPTLAPGTTTPTTGRPLSDVKNSRGGATRSRVAKKRCKDTQNAIFLRTQKRSLVSPTRHQQKKGGR